MSSARHLLVLAVAAGLLSLGASDHGEAPGASSLRSAARANTLGVAYMNQQLPEKALTAFEQAHTADPGAVIPVVNEGLAYLYLRRLPEAKDILKNATALDAHSVRAWYSLGIADFTEGDQAGALDAFQHAATLDPADPDTHYFLGMIFSADKHYDEAIAQFQLALKASPLHASAQFGLARALQRSGNPDEAREHLKRFQEITDQKIGSLISANYGEQGRYATVQDIFDTPPSALPMIPVQLVVAPGTAAAKPAPAEAHGGGVCVLDLAGNGEKDLLAVANGVGLRAFRSAATGAPVLVDPAGLGLVTKGDGVACAVGDFDNDGLPDLALALTDRVVLFRNLGHGHFANVTEKVGISTRNKPQGLTFVDFDHDGDLDLFITGTATQGQANVLWRNNGNSTFTEWTKPTALIGDGSSTEAVLSDLNNDRAVDLLVSQVSGAPRIYQNEREGAFTQLPLYVDEALSPGRGMAVADFNKDGNMDVALTHTGAPGISLWSNAGNGLFQRAALQDPEATGAWGLTPVDFDNDGWIDLAVIVSTKRGTELRVFRNLGSGGFQDVSESLGLRRIDMTGARSVLALDVDGDGAADLVIGRVDAAPLVLHNAGGSKNHSLRVNLTGLADNKTALGTKLEVLSVGNHQKFEVTGASGYMGQGSTEILAGLGSSNGANVVRLLWPTGVPQDEVDVAANKPLALTELDRRGSSCPVLFAWDGSKYAFVSDVIGAGVVGHWISPTSRNQPDADEWTKIDGSMLRARNGSLSVRFGEPMEEINYIDQLRLLAVDHPEGTEVFPDEKFLNDPPFASGRPVLASSSAHLPAAAWDNNGADAMPALRAVDHHYLRDFTSLSYAGFANEHTLTLDVGQWTASNPLRLFLRGYVEYFSASSLYAAWQAGIQPRSPSVEAQLPDGSWKLILPDMGFPAGLPRTIVADLTGKLPAGSRRIRIRTNLQIYWDQVLLDNAPETPSSVRQTELPLRSAQLEFRGYPKQIEGKTPGDLTYDYQSVSATGPFFWQRGNYTRYGEVTSLLTKLDNHFVIFGTGEDIDAEFSESALPALPRGWKRDYFFYANGFVKDMDFHEALPFTVGELPFHGMSEYPYSARERFPDDADSLAYRLEWNDRVETGEEPRSYHFDYKPSPATPLVNNAESYTSSLRPARAASQSRH